jgi:hypothetical protein
MGAVYLICKPLFKNKTVLLNKRLLENTQSMGEERLLVWFLTGVSRHQKIPYRCHVKGLIRPKPEFFLM